MLPTLPKSPRTTTIPGNGGKLVLGATSSGVAIDLAGSPSTPRRRARNRPSPSPSAADVTALSSAAAEAAVTAVTSAQERRLDRHEAQISDLVSHVGRLEANLLRTSADLDRALEAIVGLKVRLSESERQPRRKEEEEEVEEVVEEEKAPRTALPRTASPSPPPASSSTAVRVRNSPASAQLNLHDVIERPGELPAASLWKKYRRKIMVLRTLLSTRNDVRNRLGLEEVRAFIPRLVQQMVVDDASSLSSAGIDSFDGVVLFADASGFTALTEALAAQASGGAEKLCACLNRFFAILIDVIHEHGGDVVKFAGDALLIVWKSRDVGGMLPAVWAATRCGLTAIERLHNFEAMEGVSLSLHMGIGCGLVHAVRSGGVFGRWEFLIEGDPLAQTAAAEPLARPGEIVASPQVWSLLEAYASGLPVPFHVTYVRVQTLSELPDGASARTWRAARVPLELRHRDLLTRFIPAAVRARISAGQSDSLIAEMRTVSVLFIRVWDISADAGIGVHQALMSTVQKAIYHYEGSLNKFLRDDKGSVIVAIFGLPPVPHKDDPIRACAAARLLIMHLNDIGHRASIGITTGRVFCGTVGGAERREFTCMGSAVNLSARLMGAANADQAICDEETFASARHRVVFRSLTPIMVKGIQGTIAVHEPLRFTPKRPVAQSPFVGRAADLAWIEKTVVAVRDTGGVVYLTGEKGIGKSRLLARLVNTARAHEIYTLQGEGDATNTMNTLDKSEPYFAWRSILGEVLHYDAARSMTSETRAQIESYLEKEERMLVPVLNDALPSLMLAESAETARLSVYERRKLTRQLILRILISLERPCMFVLDNCQSLDPESWALARALSTMTQVVVVLCSRPITNHMPVELTEMLGETRTRRMVVTALPRGDVAELLARIFRVESVPEAIVRVVWDKTEGNPFFVERMAAALRAAMPRRADNGQPDLDAPPPRAVDLPDTIEADILGMVDRLPPREQIVLKFASVLDRTFTRDLLLESFPESYERRHLAASVEQLTDDVHMFQVVPDQADDSLLQFRSRLVQTVVAQTVLSSLRTKATTQQQAKYREEVSRRLMSTGRRSSVRSLQMTGVLPETK